MESLITSFISSMTLALPVALLVAIRAGQMIHKLHTLNMESQITDLTRDVLREKIVEQLSILLRVYRDTTENVNLPIEVNLQEVSARLFFLEDRVSFLDNLYKNLISQGTQSVSPSYTISCRVVFLLLIFPDVFYSFLSFEFLLHSTFPKRILSNISHFL